MILWLTGTRRVRGCNKHPHHPSSLSQLWMSEWYKDRTHRSERTNCSFVSFCYFLNYYLIFERRGVWEDGQCTRQPTLVTGPFFFLQLETDNRRQSVYTAELNAQLIGEEKQPLASYSFFKRLVNILSSLSSKWAICKQSECDFMFIA